MPTITTAKSKSATGPPYSVKIVKALGELKSRNGSSVPAISKQITSTYGPVNKNALSNALKKGVEDEVLVKIKASYKLGAKAKAAPKKKIVKKTPAKKAAAAPVKKTASAKPKKTIKKKTTTTSTKAKSPSKAKAAATKKTATKPKTTKKKTAAKK